MMGILQIWWFLHLWFSNIKSEPQEVCFCSAPVPYTWTVDEEKTYDLVGRLHQLPTIFHSSLKMNTLGVEISNVRTLIEEWKKFDWNTMSAKLNSFPQFTTSINGTLLHFIHAQSSHGVRKTAVVLVHGWPSTGYDFLKLIPLLLNNPEGLNTAAGRFDVIVPSMPGYPPLAPDTSGRTYGAKDVAWLYAQLVRGLGYEQYIVSGGDWGSVIIPHMAVLEESWSDKRLKGIHIYGALAPPPIGWTRPLTSLKTVLSLFFPSVFFDAYERAKMRTFARNLVFEFGYFLQHVTKPVTIGVVLQASPVATAAWLLEKYVAWTDSSVVAVAGPFASPPRVEEYELQLEAVGSQSKKGAAVGQTTSNEASTGKGEANIGKGVVDGNGMALIKATALEDKLNPELRRLGHGLTIDDMLTTISLYWLSGSMASSIMMYYNSVDFLTAARELLALRVRTIPCAIADFPVDILWAPLAWSKETYLNIVQYTRFPRGGHFPALEETELLAKDIWHFRQKLGL